MGASLGQRGSPSAGPILWRAFVGRLSAVPARSFVIRASGRAGTREERGGRGRREDGSVPPCCVHVQTGPQFKRHRAGHSALAALLPVRGVRFFLEGFLSYRERAGPLHAQPCRCGAGARACAREKTAAAETGAQSAGLSDWVRWLGFSEGAVGEK